MFLPLSKTTGLGSGVSPFQRIWRYFSGPTSYHFGPFCMIWMRLALKAWVCWEMAWFWNLEVDKVRSDVRGIICSVGRCIDRKDDNVELLATARLFEFLVYNKPKNCVLPTFGCPVALKLPVELI